MKFLPYLLIAGLLSVFLLGSSAVNFGSDHGHGNNTRGCIISAIQGTACPEESNAFSSAIFHINILKNTIMAFLGQNPELNLFSLVSVLSLLFFATASFLTLPATSLNGKLFNFLSLAKYRIPSARQQRYSAWLSLYEKRDPALSF
ncbi:MAG: hypothetical protein HYX21_00870 [Candidatus Yanofskybacteria bacterium]|nr:hypothetical protein [Candidatus Yanofskybacteria bacterium]